MQVCEAREQYVRWLLLAKDFSPHTIRAYDGDLAAFERQIGGRARVTEIDHDGLVGFIEDQRAAGISPASIRRRASGLRGFCKWLQSRHLLDSDPSADATVAIGRSRKLPRILATHELDRLFLSLRRGADVDGASVCSDVLHRPHESTTLLADSAR